MDRLSLDEIQLHIHGVPLGEGDANADHVDDADFVTDAVADWVNELDLVDVDDGVRVVDVDCDLVADMDTVAT